MADAGYDRKRKTAAAVSREQSASAREIGPLPAVADPARRNACLDDLHRFCLTYFPQRFPLPFCPDHLTVIGKLQRAVIEGGQFAVAMPRGFGKTNLCEVAALYAVLYGFRSYVVLIGSTADLAALLLASIKAEVETNDLLLADFPEACYPVRRLERINNRAAGQTLDGEPTRVEWSADTVAFARLKASACSGAVVEVRGLTGAVRGMKRPGPDGRQLRPDLVILDDPQTDESARMPGQNATRERIVNGAVLGLAGPGKTIAAVMPCTVIAPGDLADRLLDPERSPQWNGERTKLMPALPADLGWWDRYAEVRRESFRRHGDQRAATALYLAERGRADAGAAVAWPERFDPAANASAVQECMNFRLDRPGAFAAEGQNDPLSLTPDADALALDPGLVAARLTGVPRGTVPAWCSRLTAFVDVSESVLWYVVAGWDDRFGGAVADWGCWPRQNRSYFSQADARPSLRDAAPGVPVEAAVWAGLKGLAAAVLGREWPREDGQPLRVERCLVDAGDLTDTVYQFCRQSPFAATLTPSKGFGVSASGRPVGEWAKKPGELAGPDWLLGVPESGRGRLLKFGANEWKGFVADRLRTPEGGAGWVGLFGADAYAHQLLADHCAAEYPVKVTAKGRTVREWKLRPGQDNHLWDCLVGAAVAASVCGVRWSAGLAAGDPAPAAKPARRVRYSEKYRDKFAAWG